MGDELADVRAREALVEAEPEVGQLQRDVDPQALGGDAVEDLLVRVDDDAGLGLETVASEGGPVSVVWRMLANPALLNRAS